MTTWWGCLLRHRDIQYDITSGNIQVPLTTADPARTTAARNDERPRFRGLFVWAHVGSNQGPPACEAGALPLSYAPESQTRIAHTPVAHDTRRATAGFAGVAARRTDPSSHRAKSSWLAQRAGLFEENRGAWKECLALLPPGPDAVHTLPPPRRSDGSNRVRYDIRSPHHPACHCRLRRRWPPRLAAQSHHGSRNEPYFARSFTIQVW